VSLSNGGSPIHLWQERERNKESVVSPQNTKKGASKDFLFKGNGVTGEPAIGK